MPYVIERCTTLQADVRWCCDQLLIINILVHIREPIAHHDARHVLPMLHICGHRACVHCE